MGLGNFVKFKRPVDDLAKSRMETIFLQIRFKYDDENNQKENNITRTWLRDVFLQAQLACLYDMYTLSCALRRETLNTADSVVVIGHLNNHTERP